MLDALGTVTAITDQTGTVAARYVYDPYGRQLSASTGSNPNPYKYAGEYYDTQTNHYKIGARYYNPGHGRWTQRDPIDQALSPRQANPYTYAGDDPVNRSDPSGAATFDVSIPIGGPAIQYGTVGVQFGDGGVSVYGGPGINIGSPSPAISAGPGRASSGWQLTAGVCAGPGYVSACLSDEPGPGGPAVGGSVGSGSV